MKRLTLIFILIGSFQISGLLAQTKFGIRTGANFANTKISVIGISLIPDTKIGVDVAGLVNISLMESMSLQPELHFIQKGYSNTEEDIFTGEDYDLTLGLNYIEIPILFKYSYGEKVKFFPQLGPYLGYAINGYSKIDDEKEDLDLEEEGFSRIDFGIIFGAGISMLLNNTEVFFDVRYSSSLINIIDAEGVEVPFVGDFDASMKHKGLNIGLGVFF